MSNPKLIYTMLSILTISYGIVPLTNGLTHLIIIILVAIQRFKSSILIYIFLSIWINIMYQGQYQIFIFIIETILLLKAIIFIFNNNIRFKLKHVIFVLVFVSYTIISFILYKDLSAIRLIFPVITIVLFRMIIIHQKDDVAIAEFLKTFVISVVSGVLYGLINSNFMSVSYETTSSMLRFSGIQSPNYMALYINIALIICLFTNVFHKRLKYVFLIILFLALLATMSTTGILIGVIILSILIYKKLRSKVNKKKYFLFTSTCFITLTAFIIILYINLSNIKSIGAISRILIKFNTSEIDINAITNNRAYLWSIYWNEYINFEVFRNLFGSAIFSPHKYHYLAIENLQGTHNTYLDFLWALGLIGSVYFIYYIINSLYELRFSSYFRVILIIKVILFINMMSISLITNRFFYIFILI